MRRIILVVVAAALLALIVVLSGVVSVKASSGHLPVTSWILDLAKRRSVTMRARGIETPGLDDDALVRLGAAHFDRGCRWCHGAPGAPAPIVVRRMTPHPPDLAAQVGRWRPRELFYLVAHGMKFTGMPAWPAAARTDEVWAVVAFLRRLPALDAGAYRQWAGRHDESGDPAATCRVCHDGRSPLVPRLEGQSADYLAGALAAYADGRRFSGIMQPIAAALDAAERQQLSATLAAGPDARLAMVEETPSRLLRDGDPRREVPACVECHGPAARVRDPMYPALAGQPAEYLRLQLTLFAEGRRGGSPYADIMRPIAARLTPAHIDEATAAYAALPGGR